MPQLFIEKRLFYLIKKRSVSIIRDLKGCAKGQAREYGFSYSFGTKKG